MPIDSEFRRTWRISSHHDGHPVWHSSNTEEGTIHGSLVGVHIDSCIGCMKCIGACPTAVFVAWPFGAYGTVVDPARENECLFCLACEIVCPTGAIDVIGERGSESTLESLLRRA